MRHASGWAVWSLACGGPAHAGLPFLARLHRLGDVEQVWNTAGRHPHGQASTVHRSFDAIHDVVGAQLDMASGPGRGNIAPPAKPAVPGLGRHGESRNRHLPPPIGRGSRLCGGTRRLVRPRPVQPLLLTRRAVAGRRQDRLRPRGRHGPAARYGRCQQQNREGHPIKVPASAGSHNVEAPPCHSTHPFFVVTLHPSTRAVKRETQQIIDLRMISAHVGFDTPLRGYSTGVGQAPVE